jgi:hypothetical protein
MNILSRAQARSTTIHCKSPGRSAVDMHVRHYHRTMRIQAACDVTSRTALTARISGEHEGWTYTLVPNESGPLASAEIECAVPHPELFYSTIANTPEREIKATVIRRADDDLLTKLQREFQLLESLLALQYGVSSIRWAAMRYDLIFDSDAERAAASIHSWHSDRAVIGIIADMTTKENAKKTDGGK